MKNRFFLIAPVILLLGLLVTSSGWAGDEPQPQAQPQAQTAVGRISVIHGDVSTMRGDAGERVAGTVNTPLVPGDKVATADRSRAEVQLDFANIMRLDQRTEAKVADLEQNKIQIQLASGLVDFTVLDGTQADAEIDTPNMGVHPLSAGVYRIQVNSPSETLLIVRKGEAEILTNQGSTKVEAGQIIQIHGADNPEYKIDPAPAGDDFDKWSFDRDRQIESAQAWQHTDPQYTGSSDLDANGQWEQVPDYGWCWTPQVDAGWVPYSAGSWGWEPYWGWTWISAEPWGWAPYHYGRWFMYGGHWAWWPARGYGSMWSPAYVSFFGLGGRGFGVGLGFGSIGWLALGPRDIFRPWFGAGRSFGMMNFNDIHGAGFVTRGGPRFGSNLETMATDSHVRGALRSVSSQAFASGHMSRSMPVSESMMRSASMMRGTLPVAHTQGNLGNRAGNFSSNRSATASGGHFFSRSGATPAGRNSNFASEAGQARSMGQRGPTSESQMSGQRVGGATSGARTSGWQGFGSGNQAGRGPAAVNVPGSAGLQRNNPARQSAPMRATASAPQGNSGAWQRFSTRSVPNTGRTGTAQTTPRETAAPRSFGSRASGPSGWNAPAPRSESGGWNQSPSRSTYGGSRPPLQLSRPIMRERGPQAYGGGGSYSAPRGGSGGGGGRTYSAPSGGGGGSYSAPRGGGGSGGGGGHSSSSAGSHGKH
jgi:hypothetical protein